MLKQQLEQHWLLLRIGQASAGKGDVRVWPGRVGWGDSRTVDSRRVLGIRTTGWKCRHPLCATDPAVGVGLVIVTSPQPVEGHDAHMVKGSGSAPRPQ
eukprot:5928753-Pleurochrysis_carterae.AAC.1